MRRFGWEGCVVAACGAALLAVIVAVIAFGPPAHVSGYVLDKRHSPARVEYRMTPVFGGKHTRYILMPVSVPEKWELEIHAKDGDTYWRQVTEGVYESTSYGASYSD